MVGGSALLARCTAVEVAVTGAGLALGRALATDLVGTGPRLEAGTLDAVTAVVALCELALLGCALWAWAATTAVVLEAAWGRPRVHSTRGVPRAWRRLVLLACGVAIATGVALPAQATPGGVHLDPTGRHADALLAGLPMPERAVGRTLPEHDQPHRHEAHRHEAHRDQAHREQAHREQVDRTPRGPTRATTASVVVAAGDSLWQIAARTLPSDADQDAVADRWRVIYRANRAELGPDPDRIDPGQRLTLPPG